MDLVYIPEVLSYGTLRHYEYRDYEQPWNRDYFNYGKKSSSSTCTPRQNYQPKTSSKTTCQLCRESKTRSLAAYIRGKSRQNSCHEIHEEEEEEDEETDEVEENGETAVKAEKQLDSKQENTETEMRYADDSDMKSSAKKELTERKK